MAIEERTAIPVANCEGLARRGMPQQGLPPGRVEDDHVQAHMTLTLAEA